MYQLDRIDLKIINVLQTNGRITMTDLGEQVGLSTSPCAERVKRLEKNGVIMGYHAKVNPKLIGKPLLVFVELTLSSKSEEVFEQIRDELRDMPEVIECHLVSGSFDYLIKSRLQAMTDYRELLGKILSKIPVPAQSHSYVVMEEVRESSYIIPAHQP
jgi:Lrp/AsnC family leucine-responsive transcriptional regulator